MTVRGSGSEGFDAGIAEWLRRRALDPTAADASVEGARRHSVAVNDRSRALLADPFVPADERDERVDAPHGPVRVRVTEPVDREPGATILFFHGGGWIAGDMRTHLQHMRRLAAGTRRTVVGVDYRLAPEHPYPAAFDDCLAATLHAARTAGPDERIAVAGDSAGAQLAASVAIACRDARVPLAGQLLIVPVTDVAGGYAGPDTDARYPSRAERAEGYGLTREGMRWFAELYAPPGEDWRASPLRAPDLSGVAPAIVHTAGYDPLRDEGNAYAAALRAARVRVVHREWTTLNHGFFGLGGVSAAAERAARRAVADLRGLLDG
ncbi:alpha/beta hydrolase [Actinomadura sp. WMMB 499]|uniref:alpha/beta hydrolase n=1 Tax=Actinomadura sp. WMMB 499 TaxID=1219491 RepID=UPI0012459142|nr:alpha/beta hydrolase [Actinomadura sp. WMMB 499]QFG22789.1 alpha/beta hydrolase [Actinomadura sp. WMMB 499]